MSTTRDDGGPIKRSRYLMIFRDRETGRLDGIPQDEWNECMRVIADEDYGGLDWQAIYDSQEVYPDLRLIEGAMLEGLVKEFVDSRAADRAHERTLRAGAR